VRFSDPYWLVIGLLTCVVLVVVWHRHDVWQRTALARFVGRYDFGTGIVIAITRDGGSLYAQREGIPGAPTLQILPEAPLAFFWKAMDAQIRFTIDAGSVVTGASFSQGGQSLTGKRVNP